ncbi:MAG TPA: hypothetical protein VF585_09255, partial [Chthoniobacterales bacterium]
IRQSETVAFGLRTNRGVPLTQLSDRSVQIDQLTTSGFLTRSSERVFLTRQGRLVADSVAELLI